LRRCSLCVRVSCEWWVVCLLLRVRVTCWTFDKTGWMRIENRILSLVPHIQHIGSEYSPQHSAAGSRRGSPAAARDWSAPSRWGWALSRSPGSRRPSSPAPRVAGAKRASARRPPGWDAPRQGKGGSFSLGLTLSSKRLDDKWRNWYRASACRLHYLSIYLYLYWICVYLYFEPLQIWCIYLSIYIESMSISILNRFKYDLSIDLSISNLCLSLFWAASNMIYLSIYLDRICSYLYFEPLQIRYI